MTTYYYKNGVLQRMDTDDNRFPVQASLVKPTPQFRTFKEMGFEELKLEGEERKKHSIVLPLSTFLFLVNQQNEVGKREISGFGTVEDGWVSYFLKNATGSSAYVENDSLDDAVMRAAEMGKVINLQWHTHPSMSTFWSGTDKTDQEEHVDMCLRLSDTVDQYIAVTTGLGWRVRHFWTDSEGNHKYAEVDTYVSQIHTSVQEVDDDLKLPENFLSTTAATATSYSSYYNRTGQNPSSKKKYGKPESDEDKELRDKVRAFVQSVNKGNTSEFSSMVDQMTEKEATFFAEEYSYTANRLRDKIAAYDKKDGSRMALARQLLDGVYDGADVQSATMDDFAVIVTLCPDAYSGVISTMTEEK